MRGLLVLSALATVYAQPPGAASGTSCDLCGGSTTYTEVVDNTAATPGRTITSNGCPNHYSVCTGKPGITVCGDTGVEGTGTEATDQEKSFTIPANPVIATTTTSTQCTLGEIATALNGVSIYSGAVDTSCTQLDVTSALSEWTGFDMCSGHASGDGNYHYHFPPSCLLAQATAANPSSGAAAGHSPQIGWAWDGFPIYGPLYTGGAAVTGLDACNGKEEEIPDLDTFKYRYYLRGATSDLYALPTNPKPESTDAPFTLDCYKGCTYSALSAGTCTGSTGVSSSHVAVAKTGYTTQFAAYGTSGSNYAGNTYTSSFLSGGTCSTGSGTTTAAPTAAPTSTPVSTAVYTAVYTGSNPCFAAETTTACKLVNDVTAAEAHRQCYTSSESADAELVLMKTLAAGDVVLTGDAAGALSLERVVVNQHKANPLASALLEVHHSAGVLSLTPDHVLLVDGAFVPARDAKPGSALTLADGKAAVVERVAAAHGAVVNPVTASGTIVADGVVAATHPEWSWAFMSASETPLPLFYAASAAFPATTQAYYDAVLEPLFDALGAHVKPAALGASALVAPFVAADAAAALGLVAFAGAAPVALLALGAAALRSRKA